MFLGSVFLGSVFLGSGFRGSGFRGSGVFFVCVPCFWLPGSRFPGSRVRGSSCVQGLKIDSQKITRVQHSGLSPIGAPLSSLANGVWGNFRAIFGHMTGLTAFEVTTLAQ